MLPRKPQERCPEEVLREHAIMGGRRGGNFWRECESGLTRGGIASMVPARPLYVLHRTSAAEHETRMQCVAELRVPRCSRRARAPTPLNH